MKKKSLNTRRDVIPSANKALTHPDRAEVIQVLKKAGASLTVLQILEQLRKPIDYRHRLHYHLVTLEKAKVIKSRKLDGKTKAYFLPEQPKVKVVILELEELLKYKKQFKQLLSVLEDIEDDIPKPEKVKRVEITFHC